MNHQHSHHNLGHSLFTIGAFMLLFMMTILQPASLFYAYAISANEIIDQSNAARDRLGSKQLNINTSLMSAAQAKAENMAQNKYFAHYAPDGTTPWDFINQAGYSYEVAGENLAITNESEAEVIQGWLDSPTHRENLLSNQYSDMGIGIANFGDYENHKNTIIIVAFYATSKPKIAVTGTESTNPAGTVAALQTNLFSTFDPRTIIAISVALIIGGVALELRHIRNRHHQHAPPKAT